MIKYLGIIVVLACSLETKAQTFMVDSVNYVVNNYGEFTCSVSSDNKNYTGNPVLKIPATVSDPTTGYSYEVTHIEDGAFAGSNVQDYNNITSLDLSESFNLIRIGERAFQYCTFQSVDFSGCRNLRELGLTAFEYCVALSELDLSPCIALEKIEGSCFRCDYQLQKVTLPVSSALKTLDHSIFYECNLRGTIDMSGCYGLESMAYHIFAFNNDLDFIILPESLRFVDQRCFIDCGLKAIVCYAEPMPEVLDTPETWQTDLNILSSSMQEYGVLFVPEHLVEKYKTTEYWNEASSIMPINSELKITEVGIMKPDTSIDLKATIEDTDVTRACYWISSNNQVAEVSATGTVLAYSEGEVSITAQCGLEVSSVTITVSESMEISVIDTGLKYTLFSSTLTARVDGIDEDVSFLENVAIPSEIMYDNNIYAVTSINDNAFNSSSVLHGSLRIGANITQIGFRAFYNCSSLDGELVLGNALESIGVSSFENSGISGNLMIPDNVTEILDGAFRNCNNLNSLSIGQSVRVIRPYAFYNCQGLSGRLEIPDSCRIVGTSAFEMCNNISSVYINSEKTQIEDYAFFINGAFNEVRCDCAGVPECITDDVFSQQTYDNTVLLVYRSYMNNYKEATGWRKFRYINDEDTQNPGPDPMDSIEIFPHFLELLVGQMEYLQAETYSEDPAYKYVEWFSSNDYVAWAGYDGQVIAYHPGTAKIYARYGNAMDSCTLIVGDRPMSPTQLLRKGDGNSCTFVVMMPATNEELENAGYFYVYGYTDAYETEHVITSTPLRYCQTDYAIYNNYENDFWVYALCNSVGEGQIPSYRVHLSGWVEEEFNNSNQSRSGIDEIYNDPQNWIRTKPNGVSIGMYAALPAMMKVYSIDGAAVISRSYSQGELMDETFDSTNLTPGVYVVSIISGSENQQKKFIVK